MSIAYISAILMNLPDATHVFDRFHIIKKYNDMLTKLRRLVYNQETNTNKKKLLKGTCWLLLKNEKKLNEEKGEKKKLEEALLINKPLAIAYYLKEDLKLLWEQESKKEAKKFLGKWVAKAYASEVPLLYKFADSLLFHRIEIFNWYVYPISTGEDVHYDTNVVEEGYSDNNDNIYHMPGYSEPVGCDWPMNLEDFQRAKNTIANADFDDDKLTIAKQVVGMNCLTVEQVKQLWMLLYFEDTKLEFAKFAYGRTFDPGNYYLLNDMFDFSSSIDELNEYINSYR